MTQSIRLTALYAAGDAWLVRCSARPDLVRRAWDAEELAPVTSGEHWLVAESRLVTGMAAAVRIQEEQRGPVLADPGLDKLWWLVPLDALEELADVRQVSMRPAGWALDCPPSGRQVAGRWWLWRPDGSGSLTGPAVLAAAFGPGRHLQPSEAL
ncbi:hypothetical protein I2W78_17610 [Streptomyces spinoverrucosus]|uniref:hypothetical protein n=1 Tax=Streptomyces spinoverrucosus TaxID=284043 RepID=UPI0018C3ECBC|nr:hypothetical protein [Streptomyces spinoverrucosus]MBG0853613.1 hypothetical protein [Streptomyces spinoverrucosus]